jgi:hypothetical protein
VYNIEKKYVADAARMVSLLLQSPLEHEDKYTAHEIFYQRGTARGRLVGQPFAVCHSYEELSVHS